MGELEDTVESKTQFRATLQRLAVATLPPHFPPHQDEVGCLPERNDRRNAEDTRVISRRRRPAAVLQQGAPEPAERGRDASFKEHIRRQPVRSHPAAARGQRNGDEPRGKRQCTEKVSKLAKAL